MKIIVYFVLSFFILSCGNSSNSKLDQKSEKSFNKEEKQSLDEIKSILTANKREWTLASTSEWLGAGCEKGERFTFFENDVVHTFCNNGKWESRNENWSLELEKDDWKLKINNEEYFMVLKKDTLLLRKFGQNKNDPTTDNVYLSEG